jgi:hypothetical protein
MTKIKTLDEFTRKLDETPISSWNTNSTDRDITDRQRRAMHAVADRYCRGNKPVDPQARDSLLLQACAAQTNSQRKRKAYTGCSPSLSPHALRRAFLHCLQTLSQSLTDDLLSASTAILTLEELVTSRPDVLQNCGAAVRLLTTALPCRGSSAARLQDVQLLWGYLKTAATPAQDATLEAVHAVLHVCLASKIQNLLDRQPDPQQKVALVTLLRSMQTAGISMPAAWRTLAAWRPNATFESQVGCAPPSHRAQKLLCAPAHQVVKKLTCLWGPATQAGFDNLAEELLAALPNVTVLRAKTYDLGGLSFEVAAKSSVVHSITKQFKRLTCGMQEAFEKSAGGEQSLCLLFNQLCGQGAPSRQDLKLVELAVGLAEAQRKEILRLKDPLATPHQHLQTWKILAAGTQNLRPLADLLAGPRDAALRALQAQATAAPQTQSAQHWADVAQGCKAMASLVAVPPAWMQPFVAWDPSTALGDVTACLQRVFSQSSLSRWLTDALYLYGPAADGFANHFGCSLKPVDAGASKLADTQAVRQLPRATEALAVFQALRDCRAACAPVSHLAISLAEAGEAADALILLQGISKLPLAARQLLIAAYTPPAGATGIQAASLWGKFFRFPAVQQAVGQFLRQFDAWWRRVHKTLLSQLRAELDTAQVSQNWAGLAPYIKDLSALKRAAPHCLPDLQYNLLNWQVDPTVFGNLDAVTTLCTDPAERNCDLLCQLLGPAQSLSLTSNGHNVQIGAALDATSTLAVLGTAPQKDTGLYSLTLGGGTLRFVVGAGNTPRSTLDGLLAALLPLYVRATQHPAENFRAVLLNSLLSRATSLSLLEVTAATEFVAAADAATGAVMQSWVGQLGNNPQNDRWAFSALVQHFNRAAATPACHRHVTNLCAFGKLLGFKRFSGAPPQFFGPNKDALLVSPVLDAKGVTYERGIYATSSTAAAPLPDRTLIKLIEGFHSAQYDSLRSLLSDAACCPLSGSRFVHPVVAADGHAYEKSILQAWLKHQSFSPVTGEPLGSTSFVPHQALSRLLADAFGVPVQAAKASEECSTGSKQLLDSRTKYFRRRSAWAIRQALTAAPGAAAAGESTAALCSKAALLERQLCLSRQHSAMSAAAAACVTVQDEQTVDLQLDVQDLSALQRRGLGLLSAQPLIVRLQFADDTSQPPRFQMAQGPTVLATTVADGTWLSVAPPADSLARRPLKATSRATFVLSRLLSQHLAGLYSDSRDSLNLEDTLTVLQARLRSLAQHCMACDARHACTLYQPSYCHRSACAAEQRDELPDFFYEELRQQPLVADLLLSMTYAAADPNFARTHSVFLAGNPLQNTGEIQPLLNRMPSFAALQDVTDLRQHLDSTDPQLAPFLDWIMRTHRGFLLQSPPELRLPSQTQANQFLLPQMDPAREAAFQQHKRHHGGSNLFFHGTSFDRLHSIVRNGLAVYSHHALQTSGAVYGPGIYLSPAPSTALSYARSHARSAWQQSALGTSPTCLLVCEVANNAAVYKKYDIFTVQDPGTVSVRFLLTYPNLSSSYNSASYAQMAAEARQALNQFAFQPSTR